MQNAQEIREFLENYEKNPNGTVWLWSGEHLIGMIHSGKDRFHFTVSLINFTVKLSTKDVNLEVPMQNFHPGINDAGFVECSINFDLEEYVKALFDGSMDGE
jgi:hypothetical protein